MDATIPSAKDAFARCRSFGCGLVAAGAACDLKCCPLSHSHAPELANQEFGRLNVIAHHLVVNLEAHSGGSHRCAPDPSSFLNHQ
jgi:hypothetical protein